MFFPAETQCLVGTNPFIFPTAATRVTSSSIRKASLVKSCVIKLKSPPLRLRLRCSSSSCSGSVSVGVSKPQPAEVARTIMELSSVGCLSTLTPLGWPLAIGVRFAVDDDDGTPILSYPSSNPGTITRRSSFHVQLEQSGGLRTPQCTIQGTLHKPQQQLLLKKLHSIWKKKFGEALNEDFIYIVSVQHVIQMEDFMEDGIWVTSSDYKAASPDPLRDFAERIVEEINTHRQEDVNRFCNIYVDMDFPVMETKLVWVDRLGFDMRLRSIKNDTFEVRIPFPREVTDEKGVKSSFNCMSQIAWEVEKNFYAPDFNKVKQLKKISS